MSQSNGEGTFTVTLAGHSREQLKNLVRTSSRAGEIVASVKRITEMLKRDPWNFGEQRYHLYNARIQVRVASVLPIVVEYGVHMDRPDVFIRSFKALAGA